MTMRAMIAALGLAALNFAAPAGAQVIGGDVEIDGSRDDVVFLGGSMTITGDVDGDVFAIAGDGRINANVEGNIEFFGGDIQVEGRVGGELDIAGGDVDIDAEIIDDLNAAGGDVTMRGSVGGHVNAAGGSVTLASRVEGGADMAGGYVVLMPESTISGMSNIVGGEVVLQGTLRAPVEIEGKEIHLTGRFEDRVEVTAEEVNIAAGAVFVQELVVRGPSDPVIADGATIASMDYQYEAFNFGAKHWDDVDIDFDGPWHFFGEPFRYVGGAFAGSAFLLGMLAGLMAPKGVSGVARTFRARPVSSIIVGFITAAMSPVLLISMTVLLAITIIGVFLIPLIWILYLPVLFLAYAFGGIAVGDLIFNRSRSNEGLGLAMRALSLLLVLAATIALGVVDGLGALAGFTLLWIGLGAWLLSLGGAGRQSEPAGSDRAAPDKDDKPVTADAPA